MDVKTTDLCDQFASQAAVCEDIFVSFGGRKRFSGPIATVRVFEDNVLVRKMIETVPAGTVLVVDGGGSRRCALLGVPAGRRRGGTGDCRIHHPWLRQGYGGTGPDGHWCVGVGEGSAEKPQGRDGSRRRDRSVCRSGLGSRTPCVRGRGRCGFASPKSGTLKAADAGRR